jgi:hypothetical protein
MQFCAIATGAVARIDSNAVVVLSLADRCLRLLEFTPRPPVDAIVVGFWGDSDDSVTSKRLSLCAGENCIVLSWPFSRFPSLIFRCDVLPQLHLRRGPKYLALLMSFGDGVTKFPPPK